MTGLHTKTATELLAMIRARDVSVREVITAFVARHDAVDPEIRAVTSALRDEALASADAADRRIAKGEVLRPLEGLPFGVKSNIDVRGSATHNGVRAFASAVAPVDAPHVAEFRAAGAIPLVRTNMPDFALRWHTDSGLAGPTRNPRAPSSSPGGSSGGCAAAVAVGEIPLSFANDYGGSIRIPAAFCGVLGLKPTTGRVALAAALPEMADPSLTIQRFAVSGPIARSVADLRLVLDHTSQDSARDPKHIRALRPAATPRTFAVALPSRTTVQVREATEAAAALLERLGYTRVDLAVGVQRAAELWLRLVGTEIAVLLAEPLRALGSAGANVFMRDFLAVSRPLDLAGFLRSFSQLHAEARAWRSAFETAALVLGPVSGEGTFGVGDDQRGPARVAELVASLELTVAANALGLPALAFPFGSGSTTVGLQLVANGFQEEALLEAAGAIEGERGICPVIDPDLGAAAARER